MSKEKNQRVRNFACIVYPESAPSDWLDKLKSQYVPAFVSPLHDKDFDPDETKGQVPKKPHYHVLVMFEGVKTMEQWNEFRSLIGGVGSEIVQSKRGYARYLCHLDNPEKYQYSSNDVIEIAGADYQDAIKRESDRYGSIKAMINFIRNNHIISYCELMDYSIEYEPEWFRALCDNSSYVIMSYISNNRRDLY